MDDDPVGFDDLRLRFLFVPHGATVPEEMLAEFSDPVWIPAELVPRRTAPVWADGLRKDPAHLHREQVVAVPEAGSNDGGAFAPASVPVTSGLSDTGPAWLDWLTGLPTDPTKFYAPIGLRRRPSNLAPADNELLIAAAALAPATRPAPTSSGVEKSNAQHRPIEPINYLTSDVNNATAREPLNNEQ